MHEEGQEENMEEEKYFYTRHILTSRGLSGAFQKSKSYLTAIETEEGRPHILTTAGWAAITDTHNHRGLHTSSSFLILVKTNLWWGGVGCCVFWDPVYQWFSA